MLPLFYVHDLAASDAWIGIIGAAGSAGSVVGYVGVRRLARRRGGTTILLPALVAAASAIAVMSVVDWLPAVAVIAFVSGLAGAGAQLALFDGFMRTFPRELGVTFSSVDQSIQNFALIVAPNLGGLLVVALGSRQALLIMASIGFVAVALFALDARAVRQLVRRRPPEAQAPRSTDRMKSIKPFQYVASSSHIAMWLPSGSGGSGRWGAGWPSRPCTRDPSCRGRRR